VFGLDSIARAMAALANGDRTGNAEAQLHRWLAMVKGRGACRHPDGAARFVDSSVRVFADEIERHRHLGPCRESRNAPLLPTPRTGGWR
jgi:NADH:ubiquinone oxidoreductase subunit F (NADH-binding)